MTRRRATVTEVRPPDVAAWLRELPPRRTQSLWQRVVHSVWWQLKLTGLLCAVAIPLFVFAAWVLSELR